MTQQHIIRIAGPAKDLDPATTHILAALLQAEQDEVKEVAFGGSCRTEFSWFVGKAYVAIEMPEALSGSGVREALIAMAGLDQHEKFPKESDLVLEIPVSEFILEFPIDERYSTAANTQWRQLGWRVFLGSPQGPFTLRSLR